MHKCLAAFLRAVGRERKGQGPRFMKIGGRVRIPYEAESEWLGKMQIDPSDTERKG